jgi:hypothetical protein
MRLTGRLTHQNSDGDGEDGRWWTCGGARILLASCQGTVLHLPCPEPRRRARRTKAANSTHIVDPPSSSPFAAGYSLAPTTTMSWLLSSVVSMAAILHGENLPSHARNGDGWYLYPVVMNPEVHG